MPLRSALGDLVVLMVCVLLGAVAAKYLFAKLWGVVFGSILVFAFGCGSLINFF